MSASTATDPNLSPLAPPTGQVADPFAIGWRDVLSELPDGTLKRERIPLTAWDALHPQMGDVLVESNLHDWIRGYLEWVFRSQLANVSHALVTSDVGIYWDTPGLEHHSPDVAVTFDVREPNRFRQSFSVAKEGTWPKLIVEVVSPNVRANDVVTKVREYHLARVANYVIVDRVDDRWKLIGYQHAPSNYVPMPFDDSGRLWLDAVSVSLGLKDDRVACYDADGNEIGDYVVQRARADAEKARADAEKARADAAERRLRELEARFGRTPSE